MGADAGRFVRAACGGHLPDAYRRPGNPYFAERARRAVLRIGRSGYARTQYLQGRGHLLPVLRWGRYARGTSAGRYGCGESPVAYPPGQKQGSEKLGTAGAETQMRRRRRSARRRKGLQGLLERIERMALLRPGHEVLVRLLPGGGRSRPDRGRRRDAGRLLFELSGESRNQRPERNRRRMETNQPGTGERKVGPFLQRH